MRRTVLLPAAIGRKAFSLFAALRVVTALEKGRREASRSFGVSTALATVALVAFSVAALFPVAGSAQAAFPGGPNGTIIFECDGHIKVYGYHRPNDQDICAMNPDGSNQKRLSVTPGEDRDPVWSPGFDKIAFTCNSRDGAYDYDICVMIADGSGERLITPDSPREDYDPSWSPDGKKLAFTSNRGGSVAVYTMNADGTDAKVLTSPGAIDMEPAWSPDGTKIAYSTILSDEYGRLTGQRAIYVMDADGTNKTPVVTDVDASTPAWSPDGKQIAYTGTSDPGLYGSYYYDVFVTNLDGSGKKNLTKGTHFSDGTAVQANAYEAAWSPDGKRIVFTGNTGLATINPDGTNRQDLPMCSGEVTYSHTAADWGVGTVSDGNNCGTAGGGTSPTDGGTSPTDDDTSSADGGTPAPDGGTTPTDGDTSPNDGGTSSTDGDTSPPDVPTLDLVGSGTIPGTGGATNDTTPTFGGTAEPGSTVKLYDGGIEGGILLGEVKAGGDGRWEYTLETPLGEDPHSISATDADAGGNTSGESVAVEVKVETTGPGITVPQNLAPFEAEDPNGAVVTYEASATDAVDGSLSVSCDPPSGATFPVGTTTVTCKATDAAGNESTETFTVTVRDKTAPVISGVPSDVTVAPTGASGAVVTYTPPTATDAVDGGVKVSCDPPSGGTVPMGTTTVECTATDAAGNTSVATFEVSVLYGWNGFRQPINDTAHQTGATQSKFKLGQTIPVKFEIKDAAGNPVRQATNPTFGRTNNLGACDAATSPEASQRLSPDSGSAYAFTGGHYSYNWNTKGLTAGEYRIYANLADGTKRHVDICLRK